MRTTLAVIVMLVATLLSQAATPQQDQPSQNWLTFAGQPTQPACPAPTASQPAQPITHPVAQPLIGDEPYEVRFKVYGWVPSVDGRAGAGRRVSNVDVSICDVLDNLDLIECMVPIDLEVRIGHWGLYADLLHTRLEDQRPNPLGPGKINLLAKQTILELGGFYRVGVWSMAPKCGNSISLDILGGARYNEVAGNIGLQTPNHAVSIGGGREWWDPFVGPRVIWNANDKFSVFVRGDVGGFGLEHSSHFAWQIIAGADYYFTKNVFLELGYRLLDTNYTTITGPRHFTYDIQMEGPYLALGVRF